MERSRIRARMRLPEAQPRCILENNQHVPAFWETMPGEGSDCLEDAVARAEFLSRAGMRNGEIRVVANKCVVVKFHAGHVPFNTRSLFIPKAVEDVPTAPVASRVPRGIRIRDSKEG